MIEIYFKTNCVDFSTCLWSVMLVSVFKRDIYISFEAYKLDNEMKG